jgi:N-terminal domain of galactosyltransferase
MKTVFLVPYRPDGGRREDLWLFVWRWLRAKHPHDIILGESPPGPFNRSAAINHAAHKAGNWDVAIIHDADTLADPHILEAAITQAHNTGGCYFPFTTYHYLSPDATTQLLAHSGSIFLATDHTRPDNGLRPHHHSGIQAISRKAYEAIGGFPNPCQGWGAEDAIVEELLRTFHQPPEWLPGAALHLYHHPHGGDGRGEDPNTRRNRQILRQVIIRRRRPDQLRTYLETIGHHVP